MGEVVEMKTRTGFVVRHARGSGGNIGRHRDSAGYVKQEIPKSWFQVVPDKKDATIFPSKEAAQDFVKYEVIPFEGETMAEVEPA